MEGIDDPRELATFHLVGAPSLHRDARMKVAVVVASLGRATALAELLEELARQTRPPNRIVLSLTASVDCPEQAAAHPGMTVLCGPKGSCVQRNAALDYLAGEDVDVILFLDDDYLPSRFAVERAALLIERHPGVAGATGHLLADGIHGPGISATEARAQLAQYDLEEAPPIAPYRDLGGLYGCNMVFRASAIRDVRFDERLPLYGWQEDFDFAARTRPHGRIVKTFAFAGIHRGLKGGRSPGVRVGYSQVANPAYLVRKGTMDARYARKIVVRNVGANLLKTFRPEPWLDRRGRLRGNFIALFDLVRGRADPGRILNF